MTLCAFGALVGIVVSPLFDAHCIAKRTACRALHVALVLGMPIAVAVGDITSADFVNIGEGVARFARIGD